MGEFTEIKSELAQIIRLAIDEQIEDVRLFTARLIRKYRNSEPELAEQLDLYLRTRSQRTRGPLRKKEKAFFTNETLPVDDESRLSLLKTYPSFFDQDTPLLSKELKETFNQLIKERKQATHLAKLGLTPTRSAIFIGQPGLGKTLTAQWLAAQLGMPLYVLDLTAVMSSLLGRSGSNLRLALEFAKRSPCVLLLDEIDAIAKRRSDGSDIGELKRLVTVVLQEIDEWPSTGLLLAATNFPELIDPALWRRFELMVEFPVPEAETIKEAIKRFLGPDFTVFSPWIEILAYAFHGCSFSDIEHQIQRLRRAKALKTISDTDLIEEFIKPRLSHLDRQKRMEVALLLAKHTSLSQRKISDIAGVSRDTIRKYATNMLPSVLQNRKRGNK